MIRYREIYIDSKLVGFIGQDKDNNIICRAIDKNYKRLIQSLIGIIIVDLAMVENSVSVSFTQLIQPDDERWIVYIPYDLPFNYFTSAINVTTKNEFNKLKFT